jgi:hypothetical protein
LVEVSALVRFSWGSPFFQLGRVSKMHHVLAQHDLEVVMTNLLPLLPFVSGKGCEEGTMVLVRLLGEALESQEAASKRADELKQLKPRGLMELFTPEKGAAAGIVAKSAKSKGSKEQQERVPASPKKKETPKKRARKVSERAADVVLVSDDDENGEVKKPKKQGKKKGIKNGGGGWNAEEYPRITQVTKCDEGEDGLRVEVHAKKQGRGQWQKVLYSLDSAQLGTIDNLPGKTKSIVKASFQKALTALYGRKWPNALRLALAGTTWAKDIIPDGADGDFAGLDSVENINFGVE